MNGDSENNLRSWDRHVDGALTLVQLRGVSQLRNRIGRSIFRNLRTEIVGYPFEYFMLSRLSDVLTAHQLSSTQAAGPNYIDQLDE